MSIMDPELHVIVACAVTFAVGYWQVRNNSILKDHHN